jgi:hypothetical protein
MAPPTIDIDAELVTEYRRIGHTWGAIARCVNVSRASIYRWIERTGFVEPLQRITDEALDVIVADYAQPGRGEVSTAGYLQSVDLKVTRQQLRGCISRVDSVGRQQRKHKAVKRRVYEVEGPHHLWHIDGHHKLIKYGLVTHGCIDGYSRAIMYMRCTDNNQAATTLRLFQGACLQYMLPSRVRGDRGGENIRIADTVIQHRGLDRRSFIAASSKHNNRIERLWRDVRTQAIEYYKILFAGLERDGMDVTNALHLYVLQYMFMQRINEDLDRFKESWNHHKLSTEHNQSPYQLLANNGNLYPAPVALQFEDDFADDDVLENLAYVRVDPVRCPMTEEKEAYFKYHCLPLCITDAKETLVDRYMSALQFACDVINYT